MTIKFNTSHVNKYVKICCKFRSFWIYSCSFMRYTKSGSFPAIKQLLVLKIQLHHLLDVRYWTCYLTSLCLMIDHSIMYTNVKSLYWKLTLYCTSVIFQLKTSVQGGNIYKYYLYNNINTPSSLPAPPLFSSCYYGHVTYVFYLNQLSPIPFHFSQKWNSHMN